MISSSAATVLTPLKVKWRHVHQEKSSVFSVFLQCEYASQVRRQMQLHPQQQCLLPALNETEGKHLIRLTQVQPLSWKCKPIHSHTGSLEEMVVSLASRPSRAAPRWRAGGITHLSESTESMTHMINERNERSAHVCVFVCQFQVHPYLVSQLKFKPRSREMENQSHILADCASIMAQLKNGNDSEP